MKKLLSIIIPAFNEQDMLPIAYKEIKKVISEIDVDHEFIFVDDGSSDDTFASAKQLFEEGNNDIRAISFSRNFGKESAIFAGLKEAKGDCCIVMDCDLQHPAEVIPEMHRLWTEGYEIVEGVKNSRGKESALHRFMAKLFYSLISKCANIDLADASDFILLDRKAIDALVDMPEAAPFFRGLSRWIGYKTVQVPFDVSERLVGETKWSTKGLIKYAIHNITIFSAHPLQIVTLIGTLFIFASLFVAGEALFRYFTGTALGGFTTVICLILLSSGIIMISLGIIGIYLSQIYDEVKDRPRYIISRRVN